MRRDTSDVGIHNRLMRCHLSTAGMPAEKRERLAVWVETRYEDYLQAWEIRNDRTLQTMTRPEALALIARRPSLCYVSPIRELVDQVPQSERKTS